MYAFLSIKPLSSLASDSCKGDTYTYKHSAHRARHNLMTYRSQVTSHISSMARHGGPPLSAPSNKSDTQLVTFILTNHASFSADAFTNAGLSDSVELMAVMAPDTGAYTSLAALTDSTDPSASLNKGPKCNTGPLDVTGGTILWARPTHSRCRQGDATSGGHKGASSIRLFLSSTIEMHR